MALIKEEDPQFLMRRAQSGDREAFGLLYENHFTPVFRYIYFRVRNREEAQDLTQAVFLKAYEAMPRFRDMGRPPLAFFFTIARNTVVNHWRKKRDLPPSDPDTFFATLVSDGKDPLDQAVELESVRKVKFALRSLTEDQQEVITMRFIGEFSSREIAAILGKSEEAVRQLQCRGLKSIRDIMEKRNHEKGNDEIGESV